MPPSRGWKRRIEAYRPQSVVSAALPKDVKGFIADQPFSQT
jgi:hypothetical protein